ncbi:MAG: phosphate acyltransferase PlsX [Clostridia bacterium]|nr:phosphate acyltransferase PlsX [Clostridia bacterium]
MMKIIVDAFGGDNAPSEIIAGAVKAVNAEKDFNIVLVGNEDIIKERLKDYTFDNARIEIVDAKEVITNDEEPTVAIRQKKDSSLCVAFKILKEDDDAVAFVSAGSTGAVLVGATLKLGRLPGVSRPALCPVVPTLIEGKSVLILDVGANADCKANNLHDFAIMGREYSKVAFGIKNPKIGLLSNGTEDKKGNALNHEVFPLLKADESLNFIGNMEAREILSGDVDVVVTDGFSGNIAIKSIEGAIMTMLKMLKMEINSSFKTKMGGLLLKNSFTRLRGKLDYNNAGGAVFLGAKKLVIKSHGSSNADTMMASILKAVDLAKADTIGALENAFAKGFGVEENQ